jgi:hypothetical protein
MGRRAHEPVVPHGARFEHFQHDHTYQDEGRGISMTRQNPYGQFAVYSQDKYLALFPDTVPAARYDKLEDAKDHADSVTYKMVVMDTKAESRGFIYVNDGTNKCQYVRLNPACNQSRAHIDRKEVARLLWDALKFRLQIHRTRFSRGNGYYIEGDDIQVRPV